MESDRYLAARPRADEENSVRVLQPVARHTVNAATSYEEGREGRRNLRSCLYSKLRHVITTLLISTTSTIHISDY